MKKTILSICILSGSLFFSPLQLSESYVQTSQSGKQAEVHSETANDIENVIASETKVLATSSSITADSTHPDIEILKKMSDPAHSMTDLIAAFGEPTDVLRGAMDNNLLWRYDFKNNDNYVFKHELDAVDTDALKSNDLEYILYISFESDEQTIDNIAIYYIDKDGKMHEYREYADGSVKDLVEGS